MASKGGTPDYYAVLQVDAAADPEIIEAAYRQLMKKYHPDRAGDDPRRQIEHDVRAKAINEAFGVLRDPERRRMYDAARLFGGTRRPPGPSGARPTPPRNSPFDDEPASVPDWSQPYQPYQSYQSYQPSQPYPSSQPSQPSQPYRPHEPSSPPPSSVGVPPEAPSTLLRILAGPWQFLTSAYYLLPGPYEWEHDRRGELRALVLVPVIGVLGFALQTGRLAGLLGLTRDATLIVWGVLALLAVGMWRSLPKAIVASGPTVALLSGNLDGLFRELNVPILVGWLALTTVSLVFAARLYLFAVLPTVVVCLLIARLG